jgi:hypothetical protein
MRGVFGSKPQVYNGLVKVDKPYAKNLFRGGKSRFLGQNQPRWASIDPISAKKRLALGNCHVY